MNYIAIIKQHGGCDYTIGCGLQVRELRASNIPEVRDEVNHLLEEEYHRGSEREVNEITVYQTVGDSFTIDVELLYNNQKRRDEEQFRLSLEQEQKELYKKLKAKYEPNEDNVESQTRDPHRR